jgi:hypothetical protein
MPRCIYCLDEFPAGALTDEHVIPLALGGRIKLGQGACKKCNSQRSQKLDNFLSDSFPPTSLARTDLNLRSYSNAEPKTPIIATDPNIGDFELEMKPNGVIAVRPVVRRQGNALIALGSDVNLAIATLSRKMKRKATPEQIGQINLPLNSRFKNPINWETAHRAVAKIFYCYLLLELGEWCLTTNVAASLRRYMHGDLKGETWNNKTAVSKVRKIEDGSVEFPQHHHVLMFDSAEPANNFICVFGLFMFDFPLDCFELVPHGRMAAFNPREEGGVKVIENLTRYEGVWRRRTSIRWGWQREGTTMPTVFEEP